jgi:hypothetical protein
MKTKLSTLEAGALLEKYYDGATTVAEEQQLRAFLSKKKLPEQFEPDRAIFGYFTDKKSNPKPSVHFVRYARMAGIAATLALVLLCSKFLFTSAEETNFAFVDGKKITDIKEVNAHALASLQVVLNSPDEVEQSLRNIKSNEVIAQQLSVFAAIQ